MRRLSLLILLAMLASLAPTPGPGGAAYAASFRDRVAQVPASPGTGSVRIWINSDTALGETAGVETLINGSYTKRLGTFDTSYPGANWRVDIPGQVAGTAIQYQLFTRNQSGQDYGFSGFNWGYTASGQACAGGVVGDNNVLYAGLFHDSFSGQYRAPLGPVASAQGTVTLRARTCQNDAATVTLRVWNDRLNQEALYPMAPDGTTSDPSVGPVQLWKLDLPIPSQPTILYYTFRATDGTATGYYRDDDPKFLGGGFGQAEANKNSAEDNSYQISVFAPGFATPEWMQRAVIYQIFPDRFRDGDPANNTPAGSFSYGRSGGTIVRSNDPEGDWNSAVCDPRDRQGAGFNCTNFYGDNFYGGDLRGITQKIADGYFSGLGVTVIYLNPIFRAPSNHKYDTANFMEIDPDFGTLADFQAMVAAANARGIRIMLDGVFNHTSSDSPYFDRYGRYAANGTVNDEDGGTNDGSGACEAVSAEYRSWFYFEGDPNTTIFNPGGDGGTVVRCADASGSFTRSYEAWYGYSSLPKIRSGLDTVREYFYGDAGAVGPYWTRMGASGWRFDVGADVDPGLTNDPGNDYWEGFRAAVRNSALIGKTNEEDRKTVMLGEEWGDGSPWLLGDEWDSVMNYRFRSAVLGWMFTGCSGNGCANGSKFQENDSNDNSSSGSIFYLSPSQFNARLRSIHEDYPANAFRAMMNLPGSHDTQRVRFLLKKINNDSDAAAVQRMKEWWLFAFTYPGAPTLYYGDEVGLSHDGVWDGTQFQDDPYNRAPFPWPDASGGAYVPDTNNLQAFARQMASLRHSYRALQDGDVQHGLVVDDEKQLYGFGRTYGDQAALVLLNRSGATQSATFGGLNAAPYNLANGTVLVDALSGASYTVSNGSVTVSVTPSWGAVLLERSKADTPAAPAVEVQAVGDNVRLSWPLVARDGVAQPEVVTSYSIHRGATAGFTPSAANRIATLANPAFGGDPSYTDAGAALGGYSYVVRACNAAGVCGQSPAYAPAKQESALSVSPAGGTYGGSVTLQARLSSEGAALAGRSVSFSLNGAPAGSASTNAQGLASLTVSLSEIGADSYAGGVTASFAGDNAYNPASQSAALTVAKAPATLSLSAPGATYDGSPKSASASTSPASLSGVSITYDGGADAPTNAGSYTVVATLNNPNYTAAPVTRSLVIAKAQASLALNNLAQAYTGQPRPVEVMTNPADLSGVSVTYNGSATPPSAAGSYAVVATLNNPNYSAAAVEETLQIVVASQSITFDGLADKTYGDPPFAVAAAASSGLPVSFSAAGSCAVAGATVTITGAGSCSITASQAGGGNYGPAPEVTRSFTIDKASATLFLSSLSAVYSGSPLAATVTTAPTDLNGVSVTYNGSAAVPTNAGSYAVVATLDNPNYSAAEATGTLVIAKAPAAVALSDASVTYDGAAKSLTATTTPAGLTVTYTYNGASALPADAGDYTVVATVADDNYAGSATATLRIAKADQTISLTGVPASVTAGASFSVSASSNKGLPVTISVSGECSISGELATATTAGSCTVTATQAGDGNYNAASASQTASVTPAPTSYTFSGFFAPVDNPSVVNTVKAGSAIPVKFSLGGNYGLSIFAAGHPKIAAFTCSASAPTDPIETTVSATANSLSYDAATGVYTYVWKTDKGFAGSCRQLVVKLSDGQTKVALFNFTR